MFAYYEPYPIPKKADGRTVFFIAVLNMYGLLWDCGPMVRNLVSCKLRNSRRFPSLDSGLKDLVNIVYNIRTDLCHNNSRNFFFNLKIKSAAFSHIKKMLSVTAPNSSEDRWERLLINFLDRCDKFVSEIKNLVTIVKSSKADQVALFKEDWLNEIINWYSHDENLIMHVLADRYFLKHYQTASRRSVTKAEVISWVKNAQVGNIDYYKTYIEKCQSRVDSLVKSRNCPKPAFPLDFMRCITGDAANF